MLFSYKYRFVQNFKEDKNGFLKHKKLFSFVSSKSNLCYWVWVEEYDLNVYAIKFHLKVHRHSKNKYSLLTETYEPRIIVQTCLKIMLDEVYSKNNRASFGFIGSPLISESTPNNTKRFKFYRKIIASYFSDEQFIHHENIGRSAYLMINRSEYNKNTNLASQIEEAFNKHYDCFD